MRYSELTTGLFEATQEIQPTDFRLSDPAVNRAFIAKQLPQQAEIIEQTPDYKIIRTGDGNQGWIFLHNLHQDTADYVIQYKTRNWPWLNRTVTQCVLWRNPASPYVGDITKRMFFDYLLLRYGTIMSDRLQTMQGRDFWMARMRDAVKLKYKVGVAYLTQHKVQWYDPANDGPFQSWMQAQDTFGQHRKYQAIRYLISR